MGADGHLFLDEERQLVTTFLAQTSEQVVPALLGPLPALRFVPAPTGAFPLGPSHLFWFLIIASCLLHW